MNCYEAPIGTEQEWRERLNAGKLNQSINHKIHLYSYLRDLPAKQLIYPLVQREDTLIVNIFPIEQLIYPLDQREDTCELYDVQSAGLPEEDKLQDLFLSPVILEDYTRPPQAIQEMPPLYFQPGKDKPQRGHNNVSVSGLFIRTFIFTALRYTGKDILIVSNKLISLHQS
ncbi:hypothetical protein BgiBS90_009324 [Biomphalaria glabrata]|nr:hypothetical protein BgiBS90_009324 [Biomphalaria glabrata]